MLYHDSHSSIFRQPLNPPPTGSPVVIRFRCDEGNPVLRVWDGTEHLYPMSLVKEDLWESAVIMPEEPKLVWYDFIIYRSNDVARYGNADDQLGGIGRYYDHQPPSYQLTVYYREFQTSETLHHGILYQIFPDRYSRSEQIDFQPDNIMQDAHPEATFHQKWNEAPILDIDAKTGDNRALDFFGGSFKGIEAHLGELKDLGITLLYLNPVFRARTNHRYDTGDYHQLDPVLGTKEDFESLVCTAKSYGIRIILDGVFSHTGSDSKYFNRFGHYHSLGAYQNKNSEYSSWYNFDCYPEKYRCWWGFDTLPELDKANPEYQNFLLNHTNGVMPYWLKSGVFGWRLDVADELPMELLRKMRSATRFADASSVLLGEVWEDASNKVSYGEQRCYCLGDTLDSVMNYPLRRAIIDFFTEECDSYALKRVILHQREVYPTPFFYSLMNLLGSHDRVRILNALAGYDHTNQPAMNREEAAIFTLSAEELDLAKKRYLMAMKLLCALPGIPSIYYGDEIGMNGMNDPFNRAPMAWENADWSLRQSVRMLLQERKNNPLLQTGYLNIEAPDKDSLKIIRYAQDGKDIFQHPVFESTITIFINRNI